MPRKVTNELIEMAESGSLTWEMIARASLVYMSEDEVADMANVNELIQEQEDDTAEEEEGHRCSPDGDLCDDCDPWLQ